VVNDWFDEIRYLEEEVELTHPMMDSSPSNMTRSATSRPRRRRHPTAHRSGPPTPSTTTGPGSASRRRAR
jgi:hypothetical protein